MTARSAIPSGRARAGWWTLIVVSVVLVANGVWLATSVASPAVFESDSGVVMAEAAAVYPTVVDLANRRGTLLGVLYTGVAVLALVLAWSGLRTGSGPARMGLVVLTATFVAVAGVAFAGGSAMVGGVYAVFAAALAVGIALTASGRAA